MILGFSSLLATLAPAALLPRLVEGSGRGQVEFKKRDGETALMLRLTGRVHTNTANPEIRGGSAPNSCAALTQATILV